MDKLESLLREKAKSVMDDADDFAGCSVKYSEHESPDAINGDAWLENQTSYIWKVATLGVVDGNKADWVHLYIGHQRDIGSQPEFIGELYWKDGENDDVGRCLRRYIETLETGLSHPVFDND